MWDKLTPYAKSIAALLTALGTWAGVVVSSSAGAPTSAEWVGLLGAVITVVTVFLVPNAPTSDV